jgi:glycosyltransferase involved in cell wall biosynthesis
MTQLAAVVLTLNESLNIGECLSSLKWADKVVVLDSLSTDDTVTLARSHGATVLQHPFHDYASQRNQALQLVESDWIFFVDADERATPELAREVRDVIEHGPEAGWWVPRKNYIFGKWIRHTGWYPDYQMRVLKRDKARYDPDRHVHELVILDGEAGYLKNTLIHHNYQTIRQFWHKQKTYTDYDARILFADGIRPRWRNFILQPLREFWRRYVSWQGYRDGAHGLLLSLLMAYFNWVMYLRLHDLWKKADSNHQSSNDGIG